MALTQYESGPDFTQQERAAIAYAEAMTATPVHVSIALVLATR